MQCVIAATLVRDDEVRDEVRDGEVRDDEQRREGRSCHSERSEESRAALSARSLAHLPMSSG
jgi:hypothetical protein